MILTLDQAEDLARRTLAAMTGAAGQFGRDDIVAADRERVASDLAGLRQHLRCDYDAYNGEDCPDARRYSDGLLRTAALYRVTL